MKVVVRDISEEIDELMQMRLKTLLEEEKKRREKDWKAAAEYYHARYIEAETIRVMLREFFTEDDVTIVAEESQ